MERQVAQLYSYDIKEKKDTLHVTVLLCDRHGTMMLSVTDGVYFEYNFFIDAFHNIIKKFNFENLGLKEYLLSINSTEITKLLSLPASERLTEEMAEALILALGEFQKIIKEECVEHVKSA